MTYVINIDKEVGTNTFNSQFVKSTHNEEEFKNSVQILEDAFDKLKIHKKTTYRSDGEFKFADIELKRG